MPYHRLGGFQFTPGVEPDIHPSVLGDALIDCIHKVTIEKDAFTGHDVMILTGSHDPHVFGADRRVTSGGGPVTIKEGAWLCTRAIIVGPVTIGRHAVVAAGAVVVDDVPDYALVAGVPAKIVKFYREPGTTLKTKWWAGLNYTVDGPTDFVNPEVGE